MEDVALRRWTRAEYHRIGEAGILGEEERVELIDGEIFMRKAMNPPHATAVRRVQRVLERIFDPDRFIVQSQLPIAPDDYSEPQPELAVLAGTVDDFEADHPATALLVVEVSESSLRFDRGRKARLYARARIPEYWIVNLVEGHLEVHRDPEPHPSPDFGWRYASLRSLAPGEELVPIGAQAAVRVSELMPRSVLDRTS